ncbi:Prophage CP4-57 regulatory protein (AlpA) [Pseudoruegeria aquimaris]|uniref:Prophage CP4-57 regulatory protein (AlpA) n=1 Tax=Pseudoruegeria aquimaris TaxID=393663 RepID=A0A1Y5SPE5_9RHOB|nr:AlpA family phage regulatory protein [Pseudoruegeria aquimaris]SLN42343.1 Prophage CP4-57 regulatory protein (AlpA) [Pseudoruegeria aquimaris]
MTPQTQTITDRLVDIKTVCAVLCRSRASIYRDIERGDFPKPIKRGHSSRWRVSDLNRIVAQGGDMAA